MQRCLPGSDPSRHNSAKLRDQWLTGTKPGSQPPYGSHAPIVSSHPHVPHTLCEGAASCADGSHIRVKDILAYRVLLSVCRRGDGGPENRTKRNGRPASMPKEGWALVLSSFSTRGVRTDRSWEQRTRPRRVVIGLKCWIPGESDNSHDSKRISRVRMARLTNGGPGRGGGRRLFQTVAPGLGPFFTPTPHGPVVSMPVSGPSFFLFGMPGCS